MIPSAAMALAWTIMIVLVVAWILMQVFSAARRRKRLMAATPRTPIAHATGGLTKLQGRLAHCWPPLQAPISGRPCAVYQVKVFTYERNREDLLIHEIRGQPFLLHDESGRALVRYDEQTAVILKRDVRDTSRMMKDPTPAMLTLLQRHGVSPNRIFGMNRALRYDEAILEAGELVTAHGVAHREPDPEPAAAHAAGYPGATMWTVIRAAPGVDLTLTDELPFDQGPAMPPPGQMLPPGGMPPPQGGMPPR